MPGQVLGVLILHLATSQAPGVQSLRPGDRPAVSLTAAIADDLAVVTEISPPRPYVGQQFSIIYRLRARRSPAAVDIDPQQFPSLWTELVPLSAGSQAAARAGGGYSEFLLRQVIAFPLAAGEVLLPPLSLKVKRAGSSSFRREEWDVLGASQAVPVTVLPVPPPGVPGGGDRIPLVGSVRAALAADPSSGGARLATLELDGTANLALFRPAAAYPAGAVEAAELLGADSIAQTIDSGGSRRLSLLTRQRWLLRFSNDPMWDAGAPQAVFPVFDPWTESWTETKIPGAAWPAQERKSRTLPDRAGSPPAKAEEEPGSGRYGAPVVAAAAVALAVLAIAWVLLRKRGSLQ